MTSVHHALDIFEFKSMDDVTPSSLKSSFKRAIIKSHPDKGGKSEDFDMILGAYAYLSDILQRVHGGRMNLHHITSPDELKEERHNKFIQETTSILNDILDGVGIDDDFINEFNETFEKNHVPENTQGYESWFHTHQKQDETIERNPLLNINNLNELFECHITTEKPVHTTLTLHPDEMALSHGKNLGVSLIDNVTHFTQSPDYTDVQSAYTSENILFDKIPEWKKHKHTLDDAFKELCKERDIVYKTELDSDLEAIAAYEKKVLENDMQHKKNITMYFNNSLPACTIKDDTISSS